MAEQPKPIFDERFAAGERPCGWYSDTAYPKYSVGAWNCRGWDGVVIPLPHDAWRSLRVEIELSDVGPQATAFCGTDTRTALSVALRNAPGAHHQVAEGGFVIQQTRTPVPLNNDAMQRHFANGLSPHNRACSKQG